MRTSANRRPEGQAHDAFEGGQGLHQQAKSKTHYNNIA
jgi:hypothetical protein